MPSTATPTVSQSVIQLTEHVRGSVVVPGDAGWDAARRAWSPAAVVVPECVEDVATTVEFAAANGLRVAVQGPGRHEAARGDFEDALLLRMDRIARAEVDAPNRLARIEGGALWGDVIGRASPRGLAAVHGYSPDAGVIAETLSGGTGWLARAYGLAAHSVQAIEVVTADGRLVRADADHDPELFRALRGGGSLGVVTGMELTLHPVASVYAGWLAWPWERSGDVLKAWREWARYAPDEVTSIARILQLPDLDLVPEGLRGRNVLVVEAAFMGGYDEGVELFWPLRRLRPELDTFQMSPPGALATLHIDPLGSGPAMGDGFLVDDLPAEAIDAFVAAGGPASGSPLTSVELRHLGGALRRAPDDDGAMATIEAEFAYVGAGLPLSAEHAGELHDHLGLVADALAPWRSTHGDPDALLAAAHPIELAA